MDNLILISDVRGTEERLKAISEEIKDRTAIALSMVCTEETKQSCKSYRAELKKQFDEYEAERKEKTAAYEEPLRAFKKIYDQYIKEPFTSADKALKAKIEAVETSQKAEKESEVKRYADELKTAYGLTWLDTERIMPQITLSVSTKALKAQVRDSLDKIKMDVIAAQIDETGEVFAEYQKTLNLAEAQSIVFERRKAIENAKKEREAFAKQEEVKQEAVNRVDALAPPIIEEPKADVKTYTMTFTVSGTLEQLKVLKTFMLESGIEYRNG